MLAGSAETELSTLKFYALRVVDNYSVELIFIFSLLWVFLELFCKMFSLFFGCFFLFFFSFIQWRMGHKYKTKGRGKSNSIYSMHSVAKQQFLPTVVTQFSI